MKHRLIAFPAGVIILAQSNCKVPRDTRTYYTYGASLACTSCGKLREHADSFSREEVLCTPRCVHCGYLELQHTAGCCLFAPTRFTSEEYTITSSPDVSPVIQDVILGKSQG